MLLLVPSMALVASVAGLPMRASLQQVLAHYPDREQSAWLQVLTVGVALALATVIGAVPGGGDGLSFLALAVA
ncbi:MAG: hypothetical protein U0232_04150 [Thermomicrobiales bacterium]